MMFAATEFILRGLSVAKTFNAVCSSSILYICCICSYSFSTCKVGHSMIWPNIRIAVSVVYDGTLDSIT